MSLDDSARRRFAHDGYLAGMEAVDPVAATALCDRFERTYREHGGMPVRMKAHLVFRWAYELATNPAVLDCIESLLGPDLLIFSSSFWYKPPGSPSFVSWHQDGLLYGLDPPVEVAAWIALSESNRSNGCLRVLPGSHRGGLLPHRFDPRGDNQLPRGQTVETPDEAAAVDVELAPGRFSLHDVWLAHSSAPNVGDRARIGFSAFYIPTSVRSLVPGRGATLVRGSDRFGHWVHETQPLQDFDPVGVKLDRRAWEIHRSARESATT